MKIVITGAGGFISGHLAARLSAEPNTTVIGIDKKPHHEWWQKPARALCMRADLRDPTDSIYRAFEEADEVYHLACDMGGRGFIDSHEADCAMNALLDLRVIKAAQETGVKRLFYASTACIYPVESQTKAHHFPSLTESMGEPPWYPDGMYGHAKLYGEQACKAFSKDYGLGVRMGRFHGIYGPYGDWTGGKEKAPAATMRKVADALYDGRSIPCWGDGTARRSFMYVDDAVEGMIRLMRSDYAEPVNLGSEEMVTINQLVQITSEVAGLSNFNMTYEDGPVGVHGRSSDNTLIRNVLGWEPSVTLREGIERTFPWIAEQVEKSRAA